MPSIINATTTNGLVTSADNSGSLQLATNNGTTAVTIDTSQNVGIGTSSPTQRLHVSTSSDTYIQASNTSGTPSNIFMGAAGGTNVIISRDGTTGDRPLLFYVGTAERMRVTSGGDVGIGTSTITSGGKLDVNGVIYSSNGTAASPGISSRGQTNAGLFFTDDGVSSILGLAAGGNERMKIFGNGNISVTQPAGKYTCDVTGGATTLANNGTVDFSNASGMLVVNSHTSAALSIYIMGGGNTGVVASVVGQVGTMTYVAGINGYRFTNNSGGTATFGFFFVRTRANA